MEIQEKIEALRKEIEYHIAVSYTHLAKLDYNRLFLYILENRLPLFGVLLLLSFTVVGILIQILFILYFGVSFGFLCVMAITNFGWKGILYMGCLLYTSIFIRLLNFSM